MRKLPIPPRLIILAAVTAIIAGIISGVGVVSVGNPEMVDYAAAPTDLPTSGTVELLSQQAVEGTSLSHFSSITIDDRGNLIDDEAGLIRHLERLGFLDSVPVQILTTDQLENDGFDLWDDWLIPTYPQFVDDSTEFSFIFDDADDTVFIWLTPQWRGIDFNRVTTPLKPSNQSMENGVRFDPKGVFPAEGTSEEWIWNSMVSLAHWSVTPKANVAPIESRAYSKAIYESILAFPLALVAYWAVYVIYRAITNDRRKRDNIRKISTSLTLAYDALALDVLDLTQIYPGITERFEAYESAYVELTRRVGAEHRESFKETWKGLKRDEKAQLNRLALLARAQSDSLWRARLIIERRPLWKRAWKQEIAPYRQLEHIKSLDAKPWILDQNTHSSAGKFLRGLSTDLKDEALKLDLKLDKALTKNSYDTLQDYFRIWLPLPRTWRQWIGCGTLGMVAVILFSYNVTPVRNLYQLEYLGEATERVITGEGTPARVEFGHFLKLAITFFKNGSVDDSPIDVERVRQAAQSANVGFPATVILDSGESGQCSEEAHASLSTIVLEEADIHENVQR